MGRRRNVLQNRNTIGRRFSSILESDFDLKVCLYNAVIHIRNLLCQSLSSLMLFSPSLPLSLLPFPSLLPLSPSLLWH